MLEHMSGQATRILLVSTRPGARQDLEEALHGWEGLSQVSWVSDPGLLMAKAQEVRPHVVLVDADLSEGHAISLIGDVASAGLGAVVLALVAEQDIDRAREAVLAGARGWLTTPLLAGELQSTLRQALAGRGTAPVRAGWAAERLVVFCASKGGTGRTTLALNTAVSLRKRTGEPVVLVDADYTLPALDVALNLRCDRSVADLLARLSYLDEELLSGVLAAHASGIKVLLAPPPGHDGSHPVSLPQVQPILAVMKRMFPWVIVDLGLPVDETAYAFLDESDRILVSVVPEMVALRNTRRMLDQLHSRGYPEDKVWLLLNRANLHGGVGKADIEDRLRMNAKLTHLIPDDQSLVTLSINRGIPLVLGHGRSDVGRAIERLAQRLIDDLPGPEPVEVAAAPGRRWGRSRR